MLTDDELREIVTVALECESKDPDELVDHLRKKVCVDVTPYQDLISVKLSYEFHRGGRWDGGEHLLKESWYELIEEYSNATYSFGEIDGKHSDVHLSWNIIEIDILTDPYVLAKRWPDPKPRLPNFLCSNDGEITFSQLIDRIEKIDKAPLTPQWGEFAVAVLKLQFEKLIDPDQCFMCKRFVPIPTFHEYTQSRFVTNMKEDEYNTNIETMKNNGWLLPFENEEKESESESEQE